MEQVEARPVWADLTTAQRLDCLAELRHKRAAATLVYDEQIEALQAPIREQLRALEAQKLAATMAIDAELSDLETEIKLDVIQGGATVKGTWLMAVWSKGRVSWDTKRLDGYALAHPELLACRTEGEPSVSIRVNGK